MSNKPHKAPDRSIVEKALDLVLSAGGGVVTLFSSLLAIALILYSGYVLYDTFSIERGTSSWDMLAYKPEILEDMETPLASQDLAEVNSDYRAWLTVYDTNIDYPVMQGSNDLYYASHDIYKRNSLTGAIYLAAGNSGDFSDSYNLIYGHHMDSGAMFGGLDNMSGSETGILVTGSAIYDLQFFAVASTDAYENRVYNVGNRMADVLAFLESGGAGGVGVGTSVTYYNSQIARSAEKIVALSTCADAQTSGRLVVFARMTRRIPTVTLTVKKVWDDHDDQDGLRRPVIMTLSNGRTAELNEGNSWEASVDVPKYDNAGTIKYSWAENDVTAGYALVGQNTDENNVTAFTNRHVPETVSRTVTVVWDDNEDQEGLRPQESITVKLSDGTNTTDVVVTREKGWTAMVEDLPVYVNRTKVNYTWIEAEVPEYEYQGQSTNSSGTETTLVYRHDTDTTLATVKKIWHDQENQDGKRPESVIMTLSDGQTVELNEENNWEGTIAGLPSKANGQYIPYTWTEQDVEGYRKTAQETVGNVTTIENTHEPEKIDLTVSKVWEDDNDRDRIRPSFVSVALSADGEEIRTLHLNSDNGWTNKAEKLPRYANGKEIKYTWAEQAVEGYAPAQHTEGSATVLTNTHETAARTLRVRLVWVDHDNQDGLRPDSVTVKLSDGIHEVVLSEENEWSASVENLPVNENGTEIIYTWTGATVNGYTRSVATEGDLTTITETHVPAVTSRTIVKVWNDGEDQDGLRPEELSIALLANGEPLSNIDVTLNAENEWRMEVKDLPVYDHGKAIQYEWRESFVDNYPSLSRATNGSTTTFTNQHVPAEAALTLVKVWDDGNNQDGLRPDSVNVTLRRAHEDTPVGQWTLSAENNWTVTTGPLPVNAGGEPIRYIWEEEPITGYTPKNVPEAAVNGAATIMTNVHETETVTVSVVKVWDDDNDRDGVRPQQIKVRLSDGTKAVVLADGTEEWTLTGANAWTASVPGLPRYVNGQEIPYAWTEEAVEGYQLTGQTVSGNVTTLTNTHETATRTQTVTKVWNDADNRDGLRPERLFVALNGRETVELNAQNNWTASVENMPVYMNGGRQIIYNWEEPNIPGYTRTGNTVRIDEAENTAFTTLTNTPVAELTLTKEWQDGGNADGLRPESVTVALRRAADGELIGQWTLPDENNLWTVKTAPLPLYSGGEPIQYAWEEEPVNGYTPVIVTNGTATTITNVETKTVTVVKLWHDNDNQDGGRPESVTATLSNGTEVTLNAANGWTATLDNLPKYDEQGIEIAYSWTETPVPGYQLTAQNVLGNVITTLENTETISLTVAKVWNDEDNQDGSRPESVTAILSDGTEVTLNEANGWTATVDVPRYVNDEEAAYTWTEPEVDGYILTGRTTEGNTTTLTNTPAIALTVVKEWNDNDNQDGGRPDSVTATLSNGTEVTLNAANGWTATLDNLPKYDEQGIEIAYSWTEAEAEGYLLTDQTTEGNTTTLTNTPAAALTLRKVWNDGNNQDGLRPASVTVRLRRTGTNETIGQWTLPNDGAVENNAWVLRTNPLPVYDDGVRIGYTWEEDPVARYTPDLVINGTAATITNVETETVSVAVVWDDEDDINGIRPQQVTAVLSNGTEVTLNEANGWTADVPDLRKYDADGQEIVYTWTGPEVDGYTMEEMTEASLTTFTYRLRPFTLKVIKQWDDNDNEAGVRPTMIEMVLEGGAEPRRVELTAAGDWTAVLENLPRFRAGEPIQYTWAEPKIKNYEQSELVTAEEEEGAFTTTITNRYVPTVNPEEHTLTVHYRYLNDDEAAPDEVLSFHEGDVYSIPSPAIEGFAPSIRIVEGTMPGRDAEIVVIYVTLEDGAIIIDDLETPLALGELYINVGYCYE